MCGRLEHLNLARGGEGFRGRGFDLRRGLAARRRQAAERVAKRVGRLARRPERQSLCLEIGVFGRQVEERAVHGAILGEPLRELVEEPRFVGVAERLQCRPQRLDVPLDGGCCLLGFAHGRGGCLLGPRHHRPVAGIGRLRQLHEQIAGQASALRQALEGGVGSGAAAGAGRAQQKGGDRMARAPEIDVRAKAFRHVRDPRSDSRPTVR